MERLWSRDLPKSSGVDQFALVRYNSDGSLDTSLNSSGKVTTAVGTGTCKGEGVALQERWENCCCGIFI